jgi:molecular chaperone GrpE (heat shock protein)
LENDVNMVKKKSINLSDELNKKFELYRKKTGAEFSEATEIALDQFLDKMLKSLKNVK